MFKVTQFRTAFIETFTEIEKRLDLFYVGMNGERRHITEFFDSVIESTPPISGLFQNIFPHFANLNGLSVITSKGGQKGYDFLISESMSAKDSDSSKRIEMKMTAAKDTSSFTSAASQSKEDADGFMFIRIDWMRDRNFPSKLGIWFTPGLSNLPLTMKNLEKQRAAAMLAGNTAYATIKIHRDESNLITPIFGSYKNNNTWVSQITEEINV